MADCKGSKCVLGIDLSDKKFDWCLIGASGDVVDRGREALTERGLGRVLEQDEEFLVVLEVGTHSRWVSEFSRQCGHETLVANPRRLALIYRSSKKNDQNDAENLARLARVDRKLLSPIQHRSQDAQADLALIRSRDLLVRNRASLVTHVRGVLKSFGERLRSCSTPTFHKVAMEEIPDHLVPALVPVIDVITTLTAQISDMDRAIENLCDQNYGVETGRLRQVAGVGALTALTYALVLEDPSRFRNSRAAGSFLGLTPRQDESGDTRKQLSITKEGDTLLRRLLVGSAHYILGQFGPDCDLQRWGRRLAERGGKNAKKRAVVAVARRLAVLLHSLWKTGDEYDPFRQAEQPEPGQAA